ncbi:M48 family metallopeptidase [Actinokineospora iranica]|uniref:Zn-dependent protease with chaperone function n=1 Tax=Actinokineospora iranica TaxID=1271860 RepID=A0A1G6R052_9PSEU|nr:M48 family metallopeptidase [Actinokineospora iranica]SDC97435.1 Zn-dependent protease with chaperone function [Actinokineospora iranica]
MNSGIAPGHPRATFADRVAARLYTEVTSRPMLRPARDAASWLATAVAAAVHLLTLGLAVLGVLVVALADPGFPLLPIVLGAALVGLSILMRPRLGKLPRDAIAVDRAAAPTLHALVDRVTDSLDAEPVWRIILTPDYNAGYASVGLLRRPVLMIGYPLWNLLEPQERVALLGHELGHGVNGDSRRGLVVGSSLHSLTELHQAMQVRTPLAARIALGVLALPVRGILTIQERLLAHSGQHAEYFADHLSARLAGADAACSTLEKLDEATAAMAAIRTALVRGDPDIWAASRTWQETRTPTKPTEKHRIDATHPATSLRIAALASRDYGGPAVICGKGESDLIDTELAPFTQAITNALR